MPVEPVVPRHLRWTFDSFWRLASDRATDIVLIPAPMGATTIHRQPRPISAAAIHDWARTHGLDVDETAAFRYRVDAMDRVHVEHLSQAASASGDRAPEER